MSFDLATLREQVARHGRVIRVVVAEVRGSAPREVGASVTVWPDGQSGTIGGGALEYEAVRRARQLTQDQVDRIGLGPALGQCCGGAVTLLSEVWDAPRLNAITGPVATRGPGDMPLAVRKVVAQARSGTGVAARFIQGWMIEPLAPPRRDLWIFGAGHVGRALVQVLSPLPMFALSWIDTAAHRFPEVPPGVTQLIAPNPADLVRHAPSTAAHLILTYSHSLDFELCHRLLSHGFADAGLIGSGTKWARFRKRLGALGHSDAQIARIRCPIGQPALGKHPQAIAIGVASDLLSQETSTFAAKERA